MYPPEYRIIQGASEETESLRELPGRVQIRSGCPVWEKTEASAGAEELFCGEAAAKAGEVQ